MSKNRRKLKTPIQRPPKGDCLEDHPPVIMSSNKGSSKAGELQKDGLENVINGSRKGGKEEKVSSSSSSRAKDESRIEEVIEKKKEEEGKNENKREESHKSRAIPVLNKTKKMKKKSGRKVSSEKSSSKILRESEEEEEEDEKGGSDDGSLANDSMNCNGGKRGVEGNDEVAAHDDSGDENGEEEDDEGGEESGKRGRRISSRVAGMMMMKKGNNSGNSSCIERSSEPSIGHSQETVGSRETKKRDEGEEGETNDESVFMQNRISSNHHHDDRCDEEQGDCDDDEDDDVRNDSLATRNNGRKCLSPSASQVTRSDTHSSSRSLTRRRAGEEDEEGHHRQEHGQDFDDDEEEEEEDDGMFTSPDGNNNLNGLSSSANLIHQLSKKFKGDDAGKWRCPVCSLKMDSQHTFTVHIRQHNPTDHSHTCSICSKTLSSASSLDRHMLIHSGERPFKCRICGMAFTTNGNMHRHMRTHGMDVDEAEAHLLANPPVAGRGRRRKTVDPPDTKSPKSVKLDAPTSHRPTSSMTNLRGSESPEMRKKSPLAPHGLNPPKVGFFDLTFTDFSSQKFPVIAKAICEHSARRSNSPYHDFECNKCSAAFPSNSALNLHESGHHFAETFCLFCNIDLGHRDAYVEHVRTKHRYDLATNQPPHHMQSAEEKEGFMAMLQLHNRSMADSNRSNEFLTTFSRTLFNPSLNPFTRKISSLSDSNLKIDVDGQSSATNMAKMTDLADIQSIISLTKSGNHLNQLASSGSDKYPSSANNVSPTPSNETERSSDAFTNDEKESKSPQNSSDGHLTVDGDEKTLATTEGDFKCAVCASSFSSTTALKRHSRSHVSGGHNYTCTLCPYTSLDKSTLVRHLRTHNGERPFQCAICKYAFTTKANCERHVRKRHRKTSPAEISQALQFSENSGNSSLTIQNLNRHNSDQQNSQDVNYKPSSKETICKLCSVDFKFDRVLRHHMKGVHGYVAPINGSKEAKESSVGHNHKPYCCTVCKLGFTSRSKCLRHLSKQHPSILDQNSCILVNGVSDPSESNSDHSDGGHPLFAAVDFNSQSANGPVPAHSGLSNKITSSFAALCEVANNSKSNANSKPLNLTSKATDDYDAGDESEDQPFDLSKSSGNKGHQPLNLTVHPLDLSKKSARQQEPKIDVGDAADVLMSLHSKTVASGAMAANPFQAAMNGHGFFSSPFPAVANHIFGAGAFPPIPPQPAQFVDNILKILSMNPAYASGVAAPAGKPLVSAPKNERNYSCKYCLAGFTLKSNMERHIKRKHPMFAKPTRSSRRSSSSDVRDRNAEEAESDGSSPPTGNIAAVTTSDHPTTLSSKTRAALRDVLNSKVAVPVANSVAGPESSASIPSPIPFDSDTQVSDGEVTDDVEGNGDLASVSSLIDHTANSSQDLKKFLDSEGSDGHPHPSNCPSIRASTSSEELESGSNGAVASGFKEDGSRSGKKRSAYTDSPNSVSCPYCSRKFPWTSSLRRHILTHTGMKPFKCPKCPIFFTTKSNCERHLIRKHKYDQKTVQNVVADAVAASSTRGGNRNGKGPKSKQYKCNLCFSFCSTQSDLRKHYYLRHWTNGSSSRSGPNPSGLLKRKNL